MSDKNWQREFANRQEIDTWRFLFAAQTLRIGAKFVGCLMNVCRAAWVILIFTISLDSAWAVKMDEATHDLVIQRLEISLESMDPKAEERPGVLLRLADLYADRARLKAMNELSGECKDNCKASRADRLRAIELYNLALPKIEKSRHGEVLVQLAHLHQLQGQPEKSIAIYRKLAAGRTCSSEVRAVALASLGEIEFQKGDFKKAKSYFEQAGRENLRNRALNEFRLAWCQFNLGQFQTAVKTLSHLLQNPKILSTYSGSQDQIDSTFAQDISADLARFMARVSVDRRQIERLKELSPEPVRKNNLKVLAEECDRLGKKKVAIQAWAAYAEEGEVSPIEKLEIKVRLALIHYDLNQLEAATNEYEQALQIWTKNGCSDADKCNELKSALRRFVTGWHKAQSRKPTTALLRSYQAYIKVFPETDMVHWAAQVASELKKYKIAGQLFRQASDQARLELGKDPSNKSLKNIFEGSLLGEIEMAESAKDEKAKESAYTNYLTVNPNGPRALEIKFLRANVYYKSKRHKEAYSEFHEIANRPGKDSSDLKVKSADLALDALVAQKDDPAIQLRALEYARLFPQRKKEYLKISRTATLNIVAANLNRENLNRSVYKENLATLNQVNLDGADDKEKIKFYRNKIIVAQKALELDAVFATADQLLKVPGLSDTDREWAMSQKVWVSELKLNFADAYRLSLKMSFPHLSKADRELRLALLAELAGLDARKHNEAILKLSKNTRAKNLVRVSLIRSSGNPWKELDRHRDQLRKTPDLLAGITLETFARKADLARAKAILKIAGVKSHPAGQTLHRHIELKSLAQFNAKISGHRLYAYNEKVMQNSIRERLRLLGESERLAAQAIKQADWTLQLYTLSIVARENRRMYNDVLALPVPRNLNAQQKSEYTRLLKEKSQSYLNRAAAIETDLGRLWRDTRSFQNLQTAMMSSTSELQKIYRAEIKELAKVAPESDQKRLRDLLNTPYRRPSQKDILVARRELQSNPFDPSKAKRLRELEAMAGRSAMVVYLDERIAQMRKGQKL